MLHASHCSIRSAFRLWGNLSGAESVYCTAMVTVLEGMSLMMICKSCVPDGTPAGTCTFT